MELLNLWTALLRRKWLLVQAVVFFTAVGVASAILLPKSYKTSSKMMVSSSSADLSILSDLGLGEMAAGLSGADDELTNHVAQAQTRPVLDEVIWRLQIRDTDGELLLADKLLVPGMESYYAAPPTLALSQFNGTDIIQVVAQADDPELARLMADTLVEVYIQSFADRSKAESREAGSFIEKQLEVVRGEFDRALSQIADVQQQQQIIDLDSEVRSAVSRLSELVMDQTSAAAQIQALRAQIAEVKRTQKKENGDFLAPATVSTNVDIQALRKQKSELESSRSTLLLELTEKHPDVIRLETQIASLTTQIEKALTEQHDMDPQLLRLELELEGAMTQRAEIEQAIAATTQQFSAYPEKMRQLSELQLAASAAENVYKALQEQTYQIQIAEELTSSPLQFIEPALAPERHVSPKLLANTVVGFAVGIIVGLALVVLVEYIDDSIKTPDELREVWPLPQLGVIPRYNASQGVTIADYPPTHPVVESFRTLRSSITYASLDAPVRLLMITSSVPGEGKSTLMSILGVSAAGEGKRVLIVDCDLRRPTQHTFWPEADNSLGVVSVLLGQAKLEDAIQGTGVPGLDLLPAGPVPPNPGKLVESLKLRSALLEASKGYDIVLVDAPPVLVVNDALIMGRLVDKVVMVVECGNTSRRIVADARNRVQTGGIEPLGLVFNKVEGSGVYGGYGHYARAYGYVSTSAPAEPAADKDAEGKAGGGAA